MSDEQINTRARLLLTAENLINGDRAQSYGPPEESFGRIANLWTAMGIAVQAQGPGEDIRYRPVNATDVALALTQLKVARLVASPHHEDSWIDIAGYAGLGGEIALNGVRESNEKSESESEEEYTLLTFTLQTKALKLYRCSLCHDAIFDTDVHNHAQVKHPGRAYIF